MRRIDNSTPAYTFASLPDDRVATWISTRQGGVSSPPYESLNMGLRVDDDTSRVLENRERFFEAHRIPLERSVWCRQVHADTVTIVDENVVAPRDDGTRDRGAFREETIIEDTDALVTDLVDVPLVVTLADCVPVVIYDPEHHVVGLAHAGWGGTTARIASRTVERMRSTWGTDPARIVAAVGPSIAPTEYEVGPDVADRANAAYPDGKTIVTSPDGRMTFDLWRANHLDLIDAGVPEHSIEHAAMSTVANADEFYSHRFEGRPQTGRFVAIVMLRTIAM